MLRCCDESLYVGVTRRSVEERVAEHNAGLAAHTSRRRPVILMYSESHDRYDEAVATERRLKGWSRAKKIAYAQGDFAALPALAASKSPPRAPSDVVLRQAQDEGRW